MPDVVIAFTLNGRLPGPTIPCLVCREPMIWAASLARFVCPKFATEAARERTDAHADRAFTNWPETPPIAELEGFA